MTQRKRIMLLMLIVGLLMICLPLRQIQATSEMPFVKSGYCGQSISDRVTATNILWKLEDSTLTLSGKGDMCLIFKPEETPWYVYRNQVKKVIIEDGVEMLSHWAFANMENLEEVDLGETVYRICYGCFMNNPKLKSIDIPMSMMDISSYAFYNCPSLTEINNYSPYLWIPENNVFETKAQGDLRYSAPNGMLQCFYDAMVANNYK